MLKIEISALFLSLVVLLGVSGTSHAANNVVSVPEPATGVLLLSGLAGGGVVRRFRNPRR